MKSFVQIFSEPGHGAIDGLEFWPDPRIDAIHEWNVYKFWLRQFLIDARAGCRVLIEKNLIRVYKSNIGIIGQLKWIIDLWWN